MLGLILPAVGGSFTAQDPGLDGPPVVRGEAAWYGAGLFLLAASPGGAWTYPQGVPELDIIFSDGFEAEDNPNHDPVIISTPVTGGQVGVTYFYDVDATDADGDLLSFELTSLPVGMSIDPDSGEISWDPLESGSFPVEVQVSDGRGGTDSQVWAIEVLPLAQDSDGDGLTDAEEIGLGTDPNDPDSDNDGLTDGEEVNVYATNPLNFDSDGDDYGDGTEVLAGTDPLNMNDYPPGRPDLEPVAPDPDPTVPTTVFDATIFLYTGNDPVQVGVDPGTIDPERVGVVRGRVLDGEGAPLPEATVTISDHPEFGQTVSRANGMFDIAVNGGGILVVDYAKSGYLPVQRKVKVPWQGYAIADDVALIGLDPVVTTVAMDGAEMLVARGSVVTDDDGSRQATVMFPPGTTAELVLPGGERLPVASIDMRATEYTVGDDGPEQMPAELPPTSAYTYAVDFSADEALGPGAGDVEFSQPLYSYVEDIVGFPVGSAVPVGFYDRTREDWVAGKNGRVVEVLAINAGLADLDTDGDGQADDTQTLAALGIEESERATVAGLYAPGSKLWRVPITHFSAYDLNWPPDSSGLELPPLVPIPRGGRPEEEFFIECRSIVETQNQVLGHQIPVAGTPYSLNYRSDRIRGRRLDRRLVIPVTGPEALPDALISIRLRINIAGPEFVEHFPAEPNQTHVFIWDGMDLYGRTLQGRQRVTVNIDYEYPARYLVVDPVDENAFGQVPGSAQSVPARNATNYLIGQVWSSHLGVWDAKGLALGGWTLSVHHAYDPVEKVLYRGDGTHRRAEDMRIIDSVAGPPDVMEPRDIALAKDGTVYFTTALRVYSIAPDGQLSVVAGTGQPCLDSAAPCGDGGPATDATFGDLRGIALDREGGVLVADHGLYRLRRVGSDQTIETVAGTGFPCLDPLFPCGDGSAAEAALFGSLSGVDVGPDGAILVADPLLHRIRRISTDGIMSTFAGSGRVCADPTGDCGDGLPAVSADLNLPMDVAVSDAGETTITDSGNFKVRRIIQGVISTVAGNGTQCDCEVSDCGLGSPAVEVQFADPVGIASGPDGTIYVSDDVCNGVAEIMTDGNLRVLAGTGEFGYSGDGGPAAAADLNEPLGLGVAPDRSVYIADAFNDRVRRVATPLPGFAPGALLILSEDGSQIYEFDAHGRHLSTRHTLTGVVELGFQYDPAGRLVGITDTGGNTTVIERDSANLLAVVSPDGERTTFQRNSESYLTQIINPAGEALYFDYSAGGLMTRKTDPRGYLFFYEYDEMGRLVSDGDPDGALLTLAVAMTPEGRVVSKTTALGRTTTHEVDYPVEGGRRLVDTQADASRFEVNIGDDGARTSVSPDGTAVTVLQGPDPRFGMQAPVDALRIIQTPSGLTKVTSIERSVNLSDPENLLSLISWTQLKTINGRIFSKSFDAPGNTMSTTSPEGRTMVTELGELGRITRKQYSDFAPIDYAYDQRNRVTQISQGSGPDARTLSIAYDSKGYTQSTTDALARTVSFEHDAAGRIVRQILPDSREILFGYDRNGNLNSITPPGRPAHTYTHNRHGQIVEYQPPDLGPGSESISYTYDRDLLLVRVDRPDGSAISYEYDEAGRIMEKIMPQGSVTYAYDPSSGLPAAVTAPDGGMLTFSYDGSLATGMAWSGSVAGTVTRQFNDDFRVSQRSVNGEGAITFAYDDDGLLTRAGELQLSRSAVNGLVQSSALGAVTDVWTYNAFGEVVEYRSWFNSQEVYHLALERDQRGRIVRRSESIGAAAPTVTDYDYDPAGRLVEVTTDAATSAAYVYDDNSNRSSVTRPSGTQSGVFDDHDRLTQYDGFAYQYDAMGDLLLRTDGAAVTTYEHAAGSLQRVVLPDGTEVEYVVDALDRRIGKRLNGALLSGYLYKDGLNPIAELDGSGQLVSRFVYGHRLTVPDYMNRGGSTYRIISNELGSPRLVIDVADGSVVQQIDYDEYGRVTADTNPGFQPFGFAGGLYDSDTGLVQFGARDYDPETGRWIRQDPDLFSSGSTNLYLYALADPVNLIDPDGRKYEEGDFEKSNNGPPEAMEDATGTHERINETECFLFACWETGDYEEMGVMDDGLSYHRVCENGTCVETVYDPQTGLSGSVSVDIQCEGANCDDVGRRAKEALKDLEPPDPGPQPPSQPGQPPKAPNQPPGPPGGNDVDIPYEGHTNWKICK
jgi:RHS repeat-associated protein